MMMVTKMCGSHRRDCRPEDGQEGVVQRVGVADFKAKLSAHLRHVRAGEDLVVCDRDTPIVRVTAFEEANGRVSVEPASRPLAGFVRPPMRQAPASDVVETLTTMRSERG